MDMRDKIRVYIYTAVNGYSWQGCDEDLSAALQKCVGNLSETTVGGIRRQEVDGRNGTAFYRCLVRKGGDFAGRDSKYVALAFMPFATIGERSVDYAALWNHKYISQTLPVGESLEGIEIDLNAEGLIKEQNDSLSSKVAYLTDKNKQPKALSGDEKYVLNELGDLFQSRKTELGALSAKLEKRKDGSIETQPKYTPFPSVEEEVQARKIFEEAKNTNESEEEKTTKFKAWEKAVNELSEQAHPVNGKFGHFLGFCMFANEENEALNACKEKASQALESSKTLERIKKIVNIVGKQLTGDEKELLDSLQKMLNEEQDKRERLPDCSISNCKTIAKTINDIRENSEKIAAWVDDVTQDKAKDDKEPPKNIAKSLHDLFGKLKEARNDAANQEENLEKVKNECADKEKKITELEKSIKQNQGQGYKLDKIDNELNKNDRNKGHHANDGSTKKHKGRFWLWVLVILAIFAILVMKFHPQALKGKPSSSLPSKVENKGGEQNSESEEKNTEMRDEKAEEAKNREEKKEKKKGSGGEVEEEKDKEKYSSKSNQEVVQDDEQPEEASLEKAKKRTEKSDAEGKRQMVEKSKE